MPIFSIMGGVRLTESEQVIQGAMLLVRFFGAASLLLWFAGTVVIACHHDRGTSTWRLIDLSSARPTRVSKAFWSLAALSLLVWLPVLPQTQPEQIHARAMASELRGGDISQAIASLSRLRRTDFPPHWDPPPHVGYGEHNPPFFDLLELLAAPGIDAEIRALFLQKVTDDSPDHWPLRGAYVPSLDALSDAELRRLVELLKSLPEGPQVAASYRGEVSYVLRDDVSPSGGSPGPELSQERRALLETLRDIAPPEPEDDANAAIHGE